MIKKSLFFISLLVLASCASTDSSVVIEGRLLLDDESGHVQFAPLYIAGREIKTNENGFFCFEGINPRLSIPIQTKADGYKNISKELEYGDYELEITLPLDSSGEEPVFVSRTLNDIKYDHSVRYCVKRRMESSRTK